MTSFVSHYDILKVVRGAPIEVIRAAYKSLSQKYHPDRNGGSEHAARVMVEINFAYRILSDPTSRMEYDEWLAEHEKENGPTGNQNNFSGQETADPMAPSRVPTAAKTIVFSILALYAAWYFRYEPPAELVRPESGLNEQPNKSQETKGPEVTEDSLTVGEEKMPPVVASAEPEYAVECNKLGDFARGPIFKCRMSTGVTVYTDIVPPIGKPDSERSSDRGGPPVKYSRPDRAPNGSSWPLKAAYVAGYPKLKASGHSQLVVDNSRNDSDVYVKVMDLSGRAPRVIRNIFIPVGQSFKTNNYEPGQYDVRYLDLNSGGIFRTESFSLEEREDEGRIIHSVVTMTLYKVDGGNMETYPISVSEFEGEGS